MAKGKKATNVSGNYPAMVPGNAPGSVKKRAGIPASQKGKKLKTGTGGNVAISGGKAKKLTTSIGNNKGKTTSGIMNPPTGGGYGLQ